MVCRDHLQNHGREICIQARNQRCLDTKLLKPLDKRLLADMKHDSIQHSLSRATLPELEGRSSKRNSVPKLHFRIEFRSKNIFVFNVKKKGYQSSQRLTHPLERSLSALQQSQASRQQHAIHISVLNPEPYPKPETLSETLNPTVSPKFKVRLPQPASYR